MTFDDVRAIVSRWPGVEDSTSYGTPALKVKGKLIARLKEDGDTLVALGVDFNEREALLEAQARVFYITDHYRDYPAVLVRLSKAKRAQVEALPLRRWRAVAPKKLVKEFEAAVRQPPRDGREP
ncbi:MAG: MmcQ/YjbR family DNA-binding protein [Alphaproteobacteria bacterium]|nr:MmcQ/YjbR family DNA-binding protein [Alphaproteobacteria bacterium]